MKNPCLAAALQELHAAGINRITQANGGEHLQLRWPSNVTGTGEQKYTLPGTPSDWRSTANVRADIRRILRADGVLPLTERKPPAPKPASRGRSFGATRRHLRAAPHRLGATQTAARRSRASS